MKARVKTAFRLFKKHVTRFTTIIAIVLVSVGFMSGVGEVENKIKLSIRDTHASACISDLNIKHDGGVFTKADVAKIEEKFGKENVNAGLFYESEENGEATRVYSINTQSSVNQLELLEGEFPKDNKQILVERETQGFKKHAVGEKVVINNPMTGKGVEYTISGIVYNPFHIYNEVEPSFIEKSEDEYVDLTNVYYVHSESSFLINDVYVHIGVDKTGELFSSEYDEYIESAKAEVEELLGEKAVVLTLKENIGVYSLYEYAEKVGKIGIIFLVFFLLVTLLVVYSTMSRLFDEERAQMACQKTLGLSDGKIIGKYAFFVGLASVIGGGLAFLIGLLLSMLLYKGFNLQYHMPPFPKSLNFFYYAMSFGIILVASVLLTILSGKKAVSGKPAQLLTPKAPKAGKKVILERIPFIWKLLSFKYKSTARNVLLFKSRFLMTVISVVGSTVLVFAGLGLLNNTMSEGDAGAAIVGVSVVLIVFSGVLCALVIYNLTNINVSERTREIATLMVLGYRDNEVTGYIYREVYIMCAIGAILGVPLGMAFVGFVFDFISYGSLAGVEWWSYVVTPIMTMFFGFISTLLLRRKILKTDMNASLKTVE